jgi:DNA-binding transcriptional ArsR family regulator
MEAPPVEVVAGSGPAALVALSHAGGGDRASLPPELAEALEIVGDTTGETFLNLFGVSLDAGAPYSAGRVLESLRALDPVEVRRHLLGRHAWSWCTLAGAEAIDAAAAGDETAFPTLLEHPRYYGGRARDALATLLPLEPAETQRRLVNALEAGVSTLVAHDLDERISSMAGAAAAAVASADPLAAIERLTSGYRYTPEPEAERVVLIPHTEPQPVLVLAQHRGARLIVFSSADAGVEERLARLGRALADPKRLEVLGLLARGTTRVSDLVTETGLTRSTVHHHLGALRQARLVDLEGNARAYRYLAREEAASETASLLGRLLAGGVV